MKIVFFGSSLLSAYWNGAATYYRGILSALHRRGHEITFYEPDAWDRQKHRDIEAPTYARTIIYPVDDEASVLATLRNAVRDADLLVKASGIGVFDELLEEAVLKFRLPRTVVAFWDVDAAATLERVGRNAADPFRLLIPKYDVVFTYGGGEPVVLGYKKLGATKCFPIYNALDPSTHHPAAPVDKFAAALGFLGNRLPDREERVREFFFTPARLQPDMRFILGGSGWQDAVAAHSNVEYLGHVYTTDHNAFNSTPLAVLNVCRDSMARCGFSPPTRFFEAAGAGSCLITDAWEGIENFLEPGKECLVANNGVEVAEHLRNLSRGRSAQIGQAAMKRILSAHTYDHRAAEFEDSLARL
jgi:spore maturation protein CgeB